MPVEEKKDGTKTRRSSSPSLSYIFHPVTQPVITQPTQDKPHCKVFLLDGQYHIIPVDKKAKGKVVIRELFRYLELKDLQEKEYFSVYYLDLSGSKIFLNPFKQIRKQIPNASNCTTWDLFFGVQFYATKLNMLVDEMTRYLYVLQMCRDIKEKRIHADHLTKLQLVSLLVQANCGDYDAEEHKPGYVEPYIDMIYNPADIPVGLDSSVTEVHKEKTGFRPCEADNAFFMITKSLYKYGQQIFPIYDRLSQPGEIGASIVGLFLHKDGKQFMNIPWEDVITVGYRKKKLRIKYHPEGSSEDTQHMLYLNCSKPSAKLVWRGCVEQHAFFRLERPAPLVKNTVKSYYSFNRKSELRFSRGRTLYQMLKSDSKEKPEFQRSLPIIYQLENTNGSPEPKLTVKSLSVATPPPITGPEPSKQDNNKVYMTVEITKSEPDLTRVVEFTTAEKQKYSFTVTFQERTPSPANQVILDGKYMDDLDPAYQNLSENSDLQDGPVTAIACEIEARSPSPTHDETKDELAEQIKEANFDSECKIHENHKICEGLEVHYDQETHDDQATHVDHKINVDHNIHNDHEIQSNDDQGISDNQKIHNDQEIHDYVSCSHKTHVDHDQKVNNVHEALINHDHDTHVDHAETHNCHDGITEDICVPIFDQESKENEVPCIMDVFPNIFQQKKELEKWAKIILFYVHFLVIYLILFLLTRVSLLYDHD